MLILIIIESVMTLLLGVIVWLLFDCMENVKSQEKATKPEHVEAVKSTPLSEENMIEAVPASMLPRKSEGWITFYVSDQMYQLRTANLPLVQIGRRFEIHPDGIDMDALARSARKVTEDSIVGKADVVHDDDGDTGIVFTVSGAETTLEGMTGAFPVYLRTLMEFIESQKEEYGKIVEQKKTSAAVAERRSAARS